MTCCNFPLPEVLLSVSGDVFEARSPEGYRPLWHIRAEAETGTAARTKVSLDAQIIADVTIHVRYRAQLPNEVQQVAAALLWSAMRATAIRPSDPIDHNEDDGTRTPMALVEIGHWQRRIEDLLMRLHNGPISDGTGCESGDPLDVTLAQIAWTSARLEDRATEAEQRRDDALRDYAGAHEERVRLREALADVLAWGVEHDDPRIGYIVVQVDRVAERAAREALAAAAAPKEPTP